MAWNSLTSANHDASCCLLGPVALKSGRFAANHRCENRGTTTSAAVGRRALALSLEPNGNPVYKIDQEEECENMSI